MMTSRTHVCVCVSVTCRVTCQNGGQCVAGDVCECPTGVYGDLCQYRAGAIARFLRPTSKALKLRCCSGFKNLDFRDFFYKSRFLGFTKTLKCPNYRFLKVFLSLIV